MAQLIRTGPTATVAGVGHVRHGVTHTVPDELVNDLLATGGWSQTPAANVERVTEPAPSTRAARSQAAGGGRSATKRKAK